VRPEDVRLHELRDFLQVDRSGLREEGFLRGGRQRCKIFKDLSLTGVFKGLNQCLGIRGGFHGFTLLGKREKNCNL